MTGVIAGSPAYTAPEVLEGATPTPQSDVYSLGATLFCAMTGHAAFERRSGEKVVAQFLRITSQPIPDLRREGLPSDVAAAIERTLARDPSDRPASAAEFGEQLRDVQRSLGIFVDEMARHVELGVESRKAPAVPSARRCAHVGDADTALPHDEVPSSRRAQVAGCSGSARRRRSCRGAVALDPPTRRRATARAPWLHSGASFSCARASPSGLANRR